MSLDDVHGHRLLLGVAPIDVESGLDARCEKEWDARLTADLLRLALGEFRHESHDAPCSMAEKVERVLNPPGSH